MFKKKLSIGADPELFVQNKETKEFISGHLFIPGTKDKPFALQKGAVQLDGVAAEFNILPAHSSKEFIEHINHTVNSMNQFLPDVTKYEYVNQPTALFSQEYFDNLPESVRELGCNPDYDAYTALPNDKPSTELPMRTGAGHIHIGFVQRPSNKYLEDMSFQEVCMDFAIQLDYALGVNSLLWDNDQKRRSMYGNPGCIRFKPYGVEYRTLSNAWVGDNEIEEFIFNACQKSWEDFTKGIFYDSVKPGWAKDRILSGEYQEPPHALVPKFK